VIGLASGASSANAATDPRPLNNATAAAEIAVFCNAFMYDSLLVVIKKCTNAYCMV
jgi:hypothetical protein